MGASGYDYFRAGIYGVGHPRISGAKKHPSACQRSGKVENDRTDALHWFSDLE